MGPLPNSAVVAVSFSLSQANAAGRATSARIASAEAYFLMSNASLCRTECANSTARSAAGQIPNGRSGGGGRDRAGLGGPLRATQAGGDDPRQGLDIVWLGEEFERALADDLGGAALGR